MLWERSSRAHRSSSFSTTLLITFLLGLVGLLLLQSRPSGSVINYIPDVPYVANPRVPGSPYFFPHFPGTYGIRALFNHTTWMSSLFERTMLAMRDKTKAECEKDGCPQANSLRRMVEPNEFAKYDLYDPFVSCPGDEPLVRMGGQANFSDDGGKWLCMSLLTAPCVIFSVGSNNDYTFEESMINNTECLIHTYDCTVSGRNIHPRHQFHQKCLGSKQRVANDNRFITLDDAAATLGIEKINLLKIDTEGYEFDVFATWKQLDSSLPEQIAVEVHHSQVIYWGSAWGKKDDFSNLLWPMHEPSQSDLSLFFSHLGGLGYGIASREDNHLGLCCSEFLLLKIGDWAQGDPQPTAERKQHRKIR